MDVHLRFIVSSIITSLSQLPTPGPPRRVRVGSTRRCRVDMLSDGPTTCGWPSAPGAGASVRGGAGDEEDAVGCWRLPERDLLAAAFPLRALTMFRVVSAARVSRGDDGSFGRVQRG